MRVCGGLCGPLPLPELLRAERHNQVRIDGAVDTGRGRRNEIDAAQKVDAHDVDLRARALAAAMRSGDSVGQMAVKQSGRKGYPEILIRVFLIDY